MSATVSNPRLHVEQVVLSRGEQRREAWWREWREDYQDAKANKRKLEVALYRALAIPALGWYFLCELVTAPFNRPV